MSFLCGAGHVSTAALQPRLLRRFPAFLTGSRSSALERKLSSSSSRNLTSLAREQERPRDMMASSAGNDAQETVLQNSAYQKPSQPVPAPYGTWDSPFSASLVSGGSKKLGGLAVGPDDRLLWVEGRPAEGGRSVVMREGALEHLSSVRLPSLEVTPPGMSAKSKVHEYGGGSLGGSSLPGGGKGVLLFVNQADQRVYAQDLGGDALPSPGAAQALTPEYAEGRACVRYADFAVDTLRGLVFCVREDHRLGLRQSGEEGADSHAEPTNDIVSFALRPSDPLAEPRVLVSGADFYAYPRLSLDGERLAWIQWDHPNMPWDRTSLWVGALGEGGLVTQKECIAGGDPSVVEAPTEPVWSPSGQLYFVTDCGTGFWNIHRRGAAGVECVYRMEAEFSRPFWVFGNSSFLFHPGSPRHIVCFYQQHGESHLGVLDVESQCLTQLDTPLTDCYTLASGKERLFVAGGSPSIPYSVHEMKLDGLALASCSLSCIWQSSTLPDPSLEQYISRPTWVTFPAPGFPGEQSHAALYAPCNPDYVPAAAGELPPLLVRCHGGPTGAADTMLRLAVQFWTSRGWAVADVNYSGSTGYGRAYRERLYGQWGVADVADARACVELLVNDQKVDPSQVVMDGSSAGGFTCLAALTSTPTFKAGCSLYGICDLMALQAIMHKFEAHYNDQLIGPLPESAELYKKRSPIHHTDKLNSPVILFQGLEDKVVAPEQARMMYEAVKAKGLPVALVEYPGEDHGFRQARNIEQTLEQEILFFARVLLGVWRLPGISQELEIENMKPIH